ncbi:hypothetical protein [Niveispirillum sp.]|uniref:hypothetical protein n=1 Tax=Niveispirillum sp. TaxID=1917217 RepID=UPI001B71E9BC|nr:hypothetical protein [Niveispirillum sp.]MBP7336908.1 hypothetical protein [Niveispirillum sp.]
MKVNVINLIRQGAEIARDAGDGMRAYSLHELANNLLLVMQGKDSLEEFMRVYVAHGSEPVDLDAAFPPPAA